MYTLFIQPTLLFLRQHHGSTGSPLRESRLVFRRGEEPQVDSSHAQIDSSWPPKWSNIEGNDGHDVKDSARQAFDDANEAADKARRATGDIYNHPHSKGPKMAGGMIC